MVLNKFLKALHLILALVIPLCSLVILGVLNGLFAVQTTFWGEYIALLFLVYPVAIYGAYAGIIFLNFFPKKTSGALLLFIPSVIGIVFLVLQWQGWMVFQQLLFLEAVPTYLGIYTCLIGGLAYLGWKKARGRQPKDSFLRIVVFLLLIAPIIGTAVPVIQFAQEVITSLDWSLMAQVFYWGQVAVAMSVYYPKLIKLYLQDKL